MFYCIFLTWACTKYKPPKKVILNTGAVLLTAASASSNYYLHCNVGEIWAIQHILSTPPQRKVHDDTINENLAPPLNLKRKINVYQK